MTDDEFDPSHPYVRRQGRAGGGRQKGQAMTFNDWWKTYIADPGRADLRFNVQAETAALDAWEAAQAAQLTTGWPRASISDSRKGWTLMFTEDQTRAFADATCAMRAEQAAPASQDAEDAARYRYLKKYKAWDSTDVFYWLRCAPADEVDSIIDAARAQAKEGGA